MTDRKTYTVTDWNEQEGFGHASDGVSDPIAVWPFDVDPTRIGSRLYPGDVITAELHGVVGTFWLNDIRVVSYAAKESFGVVGAQKPSEKLGSAEEPIITVDGKQYSYYVAQEAIRSVVAHGKSSCVFTLSQDPGRINVIVPADEWNKLVLRVDALEAQAYGDDD